MKQRNKFSSAWLVGIVGGFLLLMCVACSSDCYVPTQVLMGVEFLDKTKLKPLTINGLTVQGVGSDSVLYKSVSTSSIFLPLHINADQTEFILQIAATEQTPEQIDTLHVDHTPLPQMVSRECGCMMFQQLNAAKLMGKESEDSVVIYDAMVQNVENAIHLKIYR